ncbi:MAG: SDR family NAD(P)-dependent oxidoreductase [Omnitrophica WOR_2 bacterium]
MRLENKVALITGGTSGIGQATARLFAAEGAQVAFTGRRSEKGHELERQIHGLYIPADHRRYADCERSVEQTLAAYGHIDILFNNAGIVLSGTAETTTDADWDETFLLNVKAVWWMSKLVLPVFRRQGKGVIVNNASDWGIVGGEDAMAYCASKGAVILMTKAMALDHARENIRVNAVCPGDTFVERWMHQYALGSRADEESRLRQSDYLPMGRVGEAEEIARAVLFLACDDSSFMTGVALPVDGGNTAQ